MIHSGSRILFGSFLVLAIVVAGCSQDNRTPAAKPVGQSTSAGPITVQIATAQRGTLSSALSFSGNVQAKQQVSLVPKVSSRVTRVAVDVGSVVGTGDVLVELEQDALAAQVAQAQAGLDAAQTRLNALEAGPRDEQVAQAQGGLDTARAKLRALEAGPRPEQVAQAEANLKSAQARLDQLKAGPTAEERRAAMEAVEGAKAQLNSVNVKKDGDCNPIYPEYLCNSSKAAAISAQHAVDAAQAQYDALVAPPTEEQLAQAQAAVDVAAEQLKLAKQPVTENDLQAARGAVAQAQAAVELAKQPVTKFDLEAARSGVAQAKAATDLAKLQLAEATIRAPFPGIISQRLVSVGSTVGPTSPILSLISSDTEVTINVDEQALADIKAGQAATITLSAYPGKEITATVASVAPAVDAQTRTAEVRLSPHDEDGVLRDGMFAQAQLSVSGTGGDLLLVPQSAVAEESGGSVVYVVANGRVNRQPVKTGASNGEQIEIVEGLAEGQQVVTSGLASLRDGAEVTVQ